MATEKRLIDANACPCVKCDRLGSCRPGLCEAFAEWWLSPVDAVEVVHGKWIAVPSSDMMTGKAYKCSECGKMRHGSYMPNYCQCCGAKMDGERKDNVL